MSARRDVDAAELFGRYLDLAPLRSRPRGVVRCIFHGDRTASLSIDVVRGLFHCFGCGTQGGLNRFAELVGATPAAARTMRPESSLQAAMRRAAQQARREGKRAAEWAPWNAGADFLRRSLCAVDQARAAAADLGPDHPRTWALLEVAADVECTALDIEGALDAILASGRVA